MNRLIYVMLMVAFTQVGLASEPFANAREDLHDAGLRASILLAKTRSAKSSGHKGGSSDKYKQKDHDQKMNKKRDKKEQNKNSFLARNS